MPARIVIVEDVPHNMQLMTYLLEVNGHTVLPAVDGREGYDAAKRHRPDLVIMDLQLPELSGEEVLALLRRDPELVGMPVLAVTALAMVGDRDRVLAAGFDGYISKPIDPRAFARAVDEHLPVSLRGETAVPDERAQPVIPSTPPLGPTVLVVDDWPTNIELVRSILEPHGYRVIGVPTVDDAVAAIQAEPPALVLCDVHLGDEQSFALHERMTADPASASVPFAFVSSSARQRSDAARRAEKLARFLPRPMEPGAFLAEVERLLADGGER